MVWVGVQSYLWEIKTMENRKILGVGALALAVFLGGMAYFGGKSVETTAAAATTAGTSLTATAQAIGRAGTANAAPAPGMPEQNPQGGSVGTAEASANGSANFAGGDVVSDPAASAQVKAEISNFATNGAKHLLFGNKEFVAPGIALPGNSLKMDEMLLANWNRYGELLAEADELANRIGALAEKVGNERTEGWQEEASALMIKTADKLKKGVAETHRGKTQRVIDTLSQMHAIDGDNAPRLRVTPNKFIGNPDAAGAYLVEVEVAPNEWKSAKESSLRYGFVNVQNNRTHELTHDIVLTMTTNPEHNSNGQVSVWRYVNVQSRGAKSGESRIIEPQLEVQDLSAEAAASYMARYGFNADQIGTLLFLK
jgi:hypothetical protein